MKNLGVGDAFVILQRIPGGDFSILLASREQRPLGQHDERAYSLVVCLELHSDEVRAVSVDRVHGYEAVAVGRNDVAVLLELYARYVRPRWLQ